LPSGQPVFSTGASGFLLIGVEGLDGLEAMGTVGLLDPLLELGVVGSSALSPEPDSWSPPEGYVGVGEGNSAPDEEVGFEAEVGMGADSGVELEPELEPGRESSQSMTVPPDGYSPGPGFLNWIA